MVGWGSLGEEGEWWREVCRGDGFFNAAGVGVLSLLGGVERSVVFTLGVVLLFVVVLGRWVGRGGWR